MAETRGKCIPYILALAIEKGDTAIELRRCGGGQCHLKPLIPITKQISMGQKRMIATTDPRMP